MLFSKPGCIYFIFLTLMGGAAFGQNAGNTTYRFLNLANSAKGAVLGSIAASGDDNLSIALINPSLLSTGTGGKLTLNYSNYVSDISYGSAGYGFNLKNRGNMSASVNFINYGSFEEADASGNLTGNKFRASDYSFSLGYGRNLGNKFKFGGALKLIYSSYDIYRSAGLAADLGISYINSDSEFCASLLARNAGLQLKTYSGQKENLPFDLQAGISQKLKHAPLRYHISYHDIQQFDLTYTDQDENEGLPGADSQEEKFGFTEKLARHFNIGLEILLSSNFNLMAGYNHQRNRELNFDGRGGLAGFSAGFGINIKKLNLSYAHSRLNAAGGNNFFSIQFNPAVFTRKPGK